MKKIILAVCLWCLFLPLTRVEAAMIGKQQEINMGKEVAQQLENQYGLVHDEELQERVNRLGQSLVQYSDRKDLNYTFKVLNSQDVNALACPGGFIYVFKGLVDFMPSDAELAGVLGHEIGHVVKRHTVHQVEKQLALSLLTLVAGVAAGDGGAGLILATTTSQALMAGYSRHDEGEADVQGLTLTQKAGYNPYGLYVTMRKLNDLSKERNLPTYGIFSSHPDSALRVERAQKALAQLQITPKVALEDNGAKATLTDGRWKFTLGQTIGSDKPEYRADLMAGALYAIKRQKPVDETHFITVDGDNFSQVYYEDREIVKLFPIDCPAGLSVSDYAGQVASQLQLWAQEVNKQGVK